MSEYRYAYLGLRRDASQVHIRQVGQGVMCRPANTNYWTPAHWASVEVDPHGNLWITLVAAHTLCARCRQAFEKEQGVKA